jgi:hypothetical protein
MDADQLGVAAVFQGSVTLGVVTLDGLHQPDAFAAQRSRPLPWETATERALGRTTTITGMPMRSRPVTFATR